MNTPSTQPNVSPFHMAVVADTLAKHCTLLAEELRDKGTFINPAFQHHLDHVVADVDAMNHCLESFREGSRRRQWRGN